jgi:putative aldouronate transport system permease protein
MFKTNGMKMSTGDKMFEIANYGFLIILMFVMVYPFYNTLVVSFNDATDSIRGQIYFFPRQFSLYNYKVLFSNDNLFHALYISVVKTLLVTVINVFVSALTAYILSQKDFPLNRFMTVFLVLTMYVNAGLIPQYFVARDLGLVNKFWVYIVPTALGAFNVIVVRTFINDLPASYAESARIDGAGDMRILLRIIMPLCKPILATVALWVAVGTWNSWFDTFIYASSKQNLSTLQYEMMKLLAASYNQSNAPDPSTRMHATDAITPNSLRAAITIIAATPIICVYPFLQKYFVKGLHLGGVKG